MPKTRFSLFPALLTICLGAAGSASAQAPVAGNPEPAPPAGRPDPAIERIRIDDGGTRIDELRVGGETQNITVTPKGNMPKYEVAPAGTNHFSVSGDRSGPSPPPSTTSWKLFSF